MWHDGNHDVRWDAFREAGNSQENELGAWQRAGGEVWSGEKFSGGGKKGKEERSEKRKSQTWEYVKAECFILMCMFVLCGLGLVFVHVFMCTRAQLRDTLTNDSSPTHCFFRDGTEWWKGDREGKGQGEKVEKNEEESERIWRPTEDKQVRQTRA